MTDEKPNMEFSDLTGRATQDGVTVTVNVYRFAGTQDPWTLEVIDQAGWSTVWSDTFESDEDALDAFTDAVEEGGGMRAFLEPPPTLH
ncbi:hypothetical protein ASF49_05130 [Methylobacterium sp. Leaf104]|uniref:hypothetical protein n=1 Tax=Methylobacterium TaxID=407 RepID=UPI0006F7BE0F|nr:MULTISPECIES: hypothetical protein [Methylobacterium]KQP38385.1 hypothetical protein ASF49_05130 [Methylobacterium sp. Leaf104]MCI9880209.1 hypothetical protein [Methylobacterium goesingense]